MVCSPSEVNKCFDCHRTEDNLWSAMVIHFMPSEIARLVLGYLRETDCKRTEKSFLEECSHLREYAVGMKNGLNYSTLINGKSLIDIIDEFSRLPNTGQQCDHSEQKASEELVRLSKQLTKIESLLNKLIQNSNNAMTSGSQNNYRLITSPPLISTTSPLFINAIQPSIGLNSTPIQANPPQQYIATNCTIPVTPSRNESKSPRRKQTPRRRVLSGASPFKQTPDCSFDESSDTLINSSSDQIRDESEPQLKIDINEPLVQPEFIVEELLNFEPFHDVLAENINKFKSRENKSSENCDNSKDKELKDDNNSNDQNIDPQEIRIDDATVNNILTHLESAPEFNTFLDKITEKELQMTPYKSIPSVESATSSASSASSLNTPQTPQMRVNAQTMIENSSNSVIKNLMTALKTPEKTITLYAARSPSTSTCITPAKVTPVKIVRNDVPQEFNYISSVINNNKNLPIIVPKVSLFAEDYKLLQNTISNNSTAYTVSVQPSPRPTPSPSPTPSHQMLTATGVPIRRQMSKKRVDFAKPASELQIKRDIIHRRILPKPSEDKQLSTTITVCTDPPIEATLKQPLILVNNSLNISQLSQQNESQSPNPTVATNKTTKRNTCGGDGSSPNKIKATDIRLPTVNILRKMNTMKMNQFLDKVHNNSNQ